MTEVETLEPERPLAARLGALLIGVRRADGEAETRRWYNPLVERRVGECKHLLHSSRIADERNAEAFGNHLERALRRLRSAVSDTRDKLQGMLSELKSDENENSEVAAWRQRRSSLVGLRKRFDRLLDRLDEGSPYRQQLESVARDRWKEATRVSKSWNVLMVCAAVSFLWVIFATFAYGGGLWSRALRWRESAVPWAEVQDALRYAFDPGWLALLTAATVAASWLAYQWLVVKSIEKSTGHLQGYFDELAAFLSLRETQAGDESPPAVPRSARSVGRLNLPRLRLIATVPAIVILVAAVGLLVPAFLTGLAHAPYRVVADLGRCTSFDAMVLTESEEQVALLADLGELGSTGLGTLVLPVGKIHARVELRDGLPAGEDLCLENEQEIVDETPPSTDDDEIAGALKDLAAVAEREQGETRRSIARLGDALLALGENLDEGRDTDREVRQRLVERVIDRMPKTVDLKRLTDAVNSGFGTSAEQQRQILAAVDQQELIEALTQQADTTDELRLISQLTLCQEIRNSLYKTWITLLPGNRKRYIGKLQKRCDEIYAEVVTASKPEQGDGSEPAKDREQTAGAGAGSTDRSAP